MPETIEVVFRLKQRPMWKRIIRSPWMFVAYYKLLALRHLSFFENVKSALVMTYYPFVLEIRKK